MCKPDALICGMTPETAERYLTVRQQIDILINQVNKAGQWLSEFDKVRPDGLCHTLAMTGVLITNRMALIRHYLEDEFASLEQVADALKNIES